MFQAIFEFIFPVFFNHIRLDVTVTISFDRHCCVDHVVPIRSKATVLNGVAHYYIAQAMCGNCDISGVCAERIIECVSSLEGLKYSFVIIEAGCAVPGDGYKAGVASHLMQALKYLGMPAARSFDIYIIAMHKYKGLIVGHLIRPIGSGCLDGRGAGRSLTIFRDDLSEVNAMVHIFDMVQANFLLYLNQLSSFVVDVKNQRIIVR